MSRHDKSAVAIFTPYFILPSELCCLVSNFRIVRIEDNCTVYAIGYHGLPLEFNIKFDELRNILYFADLEFNFHRSMGALELSWKLRHLRHLDELVAAPADSFSSSAAVVVTISIINSLPSKDFECGSTNICQCTVDICASANPGQSYLNFRFFVTSFLSNPRETRNRVIFDLLCPVHRGWFVCGSKEYRLTTDFSYLYSKRTDQRTIVAETICGAYDLILQNITAFLLYDRAASHIAGSSANCFSDWAHIARNYFKLNFDSRTCREV